MSSTALDHELLSRRRRTWLQQSAGLAAGALLGGCASVTPTAITGRPTARPTAVRRWLSDRPFTPINFETAAVAQVRVGLRPYREPGYVIRREPLGAQTLLHNYGHGGAGITLSWGCAQQAAELVGNLDLPAAERRATVIGCGVIGLTTARVLQERGWQVTIMAKEFPPHTTSDIAGGQWAPTGVCANHVATAAFMTSLAEALSISHRRFDALSRLPGSGVHWRESYYLRDAQRTVWYVQEYPQFFPAARALSVEEHPFAATNVFAHQVLMIEPAVFLPNLIDAFRANGGAMVMRSFAHRDQWRELTTPLIVNCTGLGARALLGDDDLTPIRGQLLLLPPDERIDYLTHDGGEGILYMFPRADGIVLGGSYERGNAALSPDPQTTERLLRVHGQIAAKMRV